MIGIVWRSSDDEWTVEGGQQRGLEVWQPMLLTVVFFVDDVPENKLRVETVDRRRASAMTLHGLISSGTYGYRFYLIERVLVIAPVLALWCRGGQEEGLEIEEGLTLGLLPLHSAMMLSLSRQ